MLIHTPAGHQWFVSLIRCPDGEVAAVTLMLVPDDGDPAEVARRHNPNDPHPVIAAVSADQCQPVVLR